MSNPTVLAPHLRPRRRRTGQPQTPCPGCNRFPSLEDPEVNESSVDVDGNEVTLSASIVRKSSCCSEDMKTAELEGAMSIDHDCDNADIIGRTVYVNGSTFEIEDGFEDSNVEFEGEGYTSGGGRYAAMKVGVTGSFTLTCKGCGEEVEVEVAEGILETTAGGMESAF